MDINSLKITPSLKELIGKDLSVERIGECTYDSPIKFSDEEIDDDSHFIPDKERVLTIIDDLEISKMQELGYTIPSFEKAGPRKKLYFEPGSTVSAIVTCGGLCPGLNSVIRGIVMMNFYRYNNQITYGIRYGYEGFIKSAGHEVKLLTPDSVASIHTKGGTILGSSRGNQNEVDIVNRLEELGVNILYTIGGDGTQRGAMDILKEIKKRGLKISVIGIPKTIDNDINYIDKSFGMETAFSEACDSIYSAHTEAKDAYNGIGIVRLMGRDSGFIAANATLATSEANVCLIPELDFDLHGEKGLMTFLEKRMRQKHHVLIVVAEGAGQKYVADKSTQQKDASGNLIMGDIGIFLRAKIKEHFAAKKIPVSIKYIDPSYNIRSCPPTPNDSIFCFQLAQMAVHAGMSGRTGIVMGYMNGQFTHIPIPIATLKRKQIDLHSQLWLSVLESTGQPTTFLNETEE